MKSETCRLNHSAGFVPMPPCMPFFKSSKARAGISVPHLYEQRIRELFHRLVDYTTVYSDGKVAFTFRNGVEVGTEI